MDLSSDFRPASLPVSRKSSQSQNDSKTAFCSQSCGPGVPQFVSIVPQGPLNTSAIKRAPLAPLHSQISTANLADHSMAKEEGSQNGRRPTITLTNATRPLPFSRRNMPRRSVPDKRRTSLPVLYPATDSFPQNSPYPSQSSGSPLELVNVRDYDADMYSRLSTFTFGDAQTSSKPVALTDDLDNVPPFFPISSSEKTPRPSITYSQATVYPSRRSQYWSGSSEDEDDRHRTNTRSKIRALDDGTRRPSLPSNDAYSLGSASFSEKKEKATSSEDEAHRVTIHSSSSSQKGELDTDVYLTSADDNDKRRHTKRRGSGDFSNISADGQFNSDVSSMFGDDESEHGRGQGNIMNKNEDDVKPQKDSVATLTEHSSRRGSIPIDIPRPHANYNYACSTSEFDELALAQAQVRRPSRSVDDDVFSVSRLVQRKASRASLVSSTMQGARDTAFGADISPSSEPDMRGVAMAQAIAQAHLHSQAESSETIPSDPPNSQLASANSPYQGLDLNYILSFPSPMGASTHPSTSKLDSEAWNVGRLGVSNGDSNHGRDRNPSWIAGWNDNYATGRRQSTATMNDDTFLRFVKKHDDSYEERKRQWTFVRERTDEGVSEHRLSQIWRCLWVGRYRVDRVQSKNDPSKPQIRLNVKHISDPGLKAQPFNGPVSFIHKHSRAIAFSIFRGHTLPHRHLKTSSSILLAPKRVQEQFTTTRTTSKLSTHGLLEDKNSDSTALEIGCFNRTASVGSTSSVSAMPQASKNASPKSEAYDNGASPSSSAGKLTLKMSQTSTNRKIIDALYFTNDTTVSSVRGSVNEFPPYWTSSKPDSQDTSRTVYTAGYTSSDPSAPEFSNRRISLVTQSSAVTENSQQFSSVISVWDSSSLASSSQNPHRLVGSREHRMSIASRGSIASLDEPQTIRTSHAEAFAALDPPFIEYLRMHSAHYEDGSGNESQPSRFKGLRKLFQSQALRSPKHGSPINSANAAVLEGHYEPPWLVMAARSKQEEQERVIKNLNDSFRDVGLLPSFKPNRTRQRKKNKHSVNGIFDQIPDDSLYMLLPMWPGETDPVSATMFSHVSVDITTDERRYLLVYYVPNELSKEKMKTEDKKRTRGASTASHHLESGSQWDERSATIALSSFNVLARLVSYRDIHGSGIRIPTNGLAVSGPMEDAVRAIPQVHFASDDLSLMIAFCASRERGVEVVPEGVEKLGLCLSRTSPDPDSDAPLSSLGRAAVEMAWLGALAVMGFGSAI